MTEKDKKMFDACITVWSAIDTLEDDGARFVMMFCEHKFRQKQELRFEAQRSVYGANLASENLTSPQQC